MRALLIAATLLLLAPATAAAADVVVDGRGWGHGVGLSQYGAYGYALREGRDARFILAHYYTGTSTARRRPRACGCASSAPARRSSAAPRARASGGRRVRLRDDRGYRFQALGADRLRVIDTSTGRTRARLLAPVTVTGGASTRLRGGAENGLSNGFYRGRMVLSRERRQRARGQPRLARALPVRRRAGRDAGELAGRGAQGAGRRGPLVRARSRRPVWRATCSPTCARRSTAACSPRSPPTTAAVRATRARVVTVGGAVAQTFFFSTSGGRTADQRGGVRRHADRLPALGRGPARRPVAGPHVDGALQRARGASAG